MVGELGRRGGGTSHVMNWGGCLFVVIVPRLQACRGVVQGVARGNDDLADIPIIDHALCCRGRVELAKVVPWRIGQELR